MDVALSDLLTCPRCGPGYGLILLPEEIRERRVVAGVLGCANCRERYAVEGGVADLRVGEAGADAEEGPVSGSVADPESTVRLAALLGLTAPGGTVLLAGPGAAEAAGLAELVEGVSVVAVAGAGVASGGAGQVSWLRVGARLPLRGGSVRGVALTGVWAERVEEGARLLGPAGRLVVEPPPEGARARAEAAGLRVLLEEGEVLVAGRGE